MYPYTCLHVKNNAVVFIKETFYGLSFNQGFPKIMKNLNVKENKPTVVTLNERLLMAMCKRVNTRFSFMS